MPSERATQTHHPETQQEPYFIRPLRADWLTAAFNEDCAMRLIEPCSVCGALGFSAREDESAQPILEGHVAKFWPLPPVEPAGRMGASEPEVVHDPERPCREAEAPLPRTISRVATTKRR